jgi:hypothetical protein
MMLFQPKKPGGIQEVSGSIRLISTRTFSNVRNLPVFMPFLQTAPMHFVLNQDVL